MGIAANVVIGLLVVGTSHTARKFKSVSVRSSYLSDSSLPLYYIRHQAGTGSEPSHWDAFRPCKQEELGD